VKRDLIGALRLAAVLTLALVALAVVAPGRLGLALRIYALVVCAEVLVVTLAALRRAYPAETPVRQVARSAAARRQPPPSLSRIELEAALGTAGSFDLHYRLVPRLRAIAAGLLASRRQVSLAASPATAHAILGDTTWELVRPDRPAPEDRLARGIAPPELAEVVDTLEGT
jgi:hypothetical protein